MRTGLWTLCIRIQSFKVFGCANESAVLTEKLCFHLEWDEMDSPLCILFGALFFYVENNLVLYRSWEIPMRSEDLIDYFSRNLTNSVLQHPLTITFYLKLSTHLPRSQRQGQCNSFILESCPLSSHQAHLCSLMNIWRKCEEILRKITKRSKGKQNLL